MFRRWILGILILFLIFEIIILFPSDFRWDTANPEDQKAQIDDLDGSDQVMRGVYLVEVTDQKEWELWSEEAKSKKELSKDLWDLTTVKVIFFSDEGQEFTVTGKKGLVNVQTKDLKIFGDVVMVSDNGYQFFTEEALYRSGSRFLDAPQPIKMIGPPDEKGQVIDLVGDKMNADLNISQMDVIGNVRAHQVLEDGKVAKIISRKARFFGDSRQAEFFEQVVIDYDTMRITGPKAKFHYDQNSKQMKSLEVVGGARMSDDSKWATSKTLFIDFNEQMYLLKGEPRVVQDDDELVGAEIVFFEGGDKMVVRGGEALVDEQRAQSR